MSRSTHPDPLFELATLWVLVQRGRRLIADRTQHALTSRLTPSQTREEAPRAWEQIEPD